MGLAAALLSRWEASVGRNAPTFTNGITMVTILQLFSGTFFHCFQALAGNDLYNMQKNKIMRKL